MPPDVLRLDEAASFPFPGLAARTSAAALGGAREVGLAMLMACRLAADAVEPGRLSAEARRERAQGARQWLSTLALPLPVRTAAGRAFEATADDSREALGAGLLLLLTAAASYLDEPAQGEVRRLVTRITS